MSSYPQIRLFTELAAQFRWEVSPGEGLLARHWMCWVQVERAGQSIRMPVDNEYGDAQSGVPAILLQLVLLAMEDYEEAADFLVWMKDLGLRSDTEAWLLIYKEIQENLPALQTWFGDLEPISNWDWQMHAGAAQELRALAEKK